MAKLLAGIVSAPLALVLGIATLTGGDSPPPYQPGASALAVSEIPAFLLPVYRVASSRCGGLPWQVLAAIGFIESRHGGGRIDPSTGDTNPAILGPPLDGSNGTARIADPREADGWAHAHGPMQFLASTWARWGVLAPGRPGAATPSADNGFDAIHGAARLLCGDEARVDDLGAAIWRYNHSGDYVEAVLAKAASYGLFGEPTPAANLHAAVAGQTVGGSADAVMAAGYSVMGTPYQWGGSRPETGFDCSGLVQWSYAHAGIALPRTTFDQVKVGVAVGIDELRPADLIFSRGGKTPEDFGHVALYAGGGKILVAPHTGAVVELERLDPSRVQTIRRIITPPAA